MADTNGKQIALLLGVYATFALDVFSTLNSSPQTTELFSKDREDSLMHWVVIGDVAAVSGGAVASVITGDVWPIVAVVGIVILMHLLYRHAVNRGQDQTAPADASGY